MREFFKGWRRFPIALAASVFRFVVLLLIGAVVCASLFVSLRAWSTYSYEKHCERLVKEAGGGVMWYTIGPDWIPEPARERAPIFFSRIGLLNLSKVDEAPSLLKKCSQCQYIDYCVLNSTSVGDREMEYLARWPNLWELNLSHTQITVGRKRCQEPFSLPDPS